ncbi:hypothetical protein ACJX0J_021511 [Zea mays]
MLHALLFYYALSINYLSNEMLLLPFSYTTSHNNTLMPGVIRRILRAYFRLLFFGFFSRSKQTCPWWFRYSFGVKGGIGFIGPYFMLRRQIKVIDTDIFIRYVHRKKKIPHFGRFKTHDEVSTAGNRVGTLLWHNLLLSSICYKKEYISLSMNQIVQYSIVKPY